jgi:hypothetical protein
VKVRGGEGGGRVPHPRTWKVLSLGIGMQLAPHLNSLIPLSLYYRV